MLKAVTRRPVFFVPRARQSRRYQVQFTSDLRLWSTTVPVILGDGQWHSWLDNGSPKTDELPAFSACRFYRLIELP